jgi:hypothetical protein
MFGNGVAICAHLECTLFIYFAIQPISDRRVHGITVVSSDSDGAVAELERRGREAF